MICDKNFFFKNAITFLFFNRIQNGFHLPEGLIFLDLMHLKKNKVQNRWDISKKLPK